MKIILILGNKLLPSGKMSNILVKRLETAIKLYKKNDIFLVSGGNIANVKHTEAYMMKKYITHRIPNATIISEPKSISTLQNIKNSYRILKKYPHDVIIVTSKNHIKRVKQIISDFKDVKWIINI